MNSMKYFIYVGQMVKNFEHAHFFYKHAEANNANQDQNVPPLETV